MDVVYTAYASRTAAVSSASKPITHEDFGFTANDLLIARRAVITVRTAGVMFQYGPTPGVTLSATVGHHLPINSTVAVNGNENINRLRFLRDASTDAAMTITLES